jgi:UDP-N-acetylmuramate--alanine ligase
MERSNERTRDPGGLRAHAHVLGGGPAGLAGLAESLAWRGMEVTRSHAAADDDPVGLRVVAGRVRHDLPARLWSDRTRLLVHAGEVAPYHPLRLRALRRGVPQRTPADWLAEELRGRFGVAFSGSGAAAAAALTGLALASAGMDPSVLLETHAPQLGGRARVGAGVPFVVEWSEACGSLTEARPCLAIVLGPDLKDESPPPPDQWAERVARVADGLVVAGGMVIAWGHPTWRVGPAAPVEWLSLRQGSDWWASDLREDSGRFRFRIFYRGRYVIEVRLRTPGLRHVLPALAATAACVTAGVACTVVRDAVEEFAGLAREFEHRGSFRGVTLIDDAAVDPEPVYDALADARRAFGRRRLRAVYAAAGSSNHEAEWRRFVPAFSLADEVILADGLGPDTQARPDAEPTAAGGLTRVLASAGLAARQATGIAAVVSELDRQLEPGDVLLTLGAGDVGTIADAFLRRLPRDRPGG